MKKVIRVLSKIALASVSIASAIITIFIMTKMLYLTIASVIVKRTGHRVVNIFSDKDIFGVEDIVKRQLKSFNSIR